MNWDSRVREMGKALSRYNGLTNSARLDLIAEATAEDLFKNRPFSYAYEIRKYFEKEKMGARSAEVHVHHGIAFGLLYRAVPGFSTYHPNARLQSKLETTSRIALTPLGRICRAAVLQKREDLRKLILTYALLNADFDMYALLIKMTQDNNKRAPDEEKFTQQYRDILEKRFAWMKEYFQSRVQLEQIKLYVRWIGRGKTGRKREIAPSEISHFAGKTPEHHFKQRKKWAKLLEHLDKDMLTDSGEDLANRLPDVNREPFFWLPPPMKTSTKANIISLAEIDINQCPPAWQILRPKIQLIDNNKYKKMTEKVADFMKKDFEHIRLGKFQQSSLDVVVPYVYLLEREFGGCVDKHLFFENLLKEYKDQFACSLQPNLSQCHYRLR